MRQTEVSQAKQAVKELAWRLVDNQACHARPLRDSQAQMLMLLELMLDLLLELLLLLLLLLLLRLLLPQKRW